MQKRVVSKKKTGSMGKKPRGFFFYLKLYFVCVAVTLFSFSITTLFRAQNSTPLCANSQTCTSDLREHIDNNAVGIFEGKTVIPPKIDDTLASASVLGATTLPSGDKHIYVDLSSQTLYAYQGSTPFMQTFVSTGRWNKTPTGNFHVWEKLVSTRMAGGEGQDAYDLPNVPYVMYFYNDFGLHGAYWHDNFGHTMSHGCVNMRQVDAQKLFAWVDGPQGGTLGTAVSICDHFTSSTMQCVQDNPVQQ